ncbi:DGQHR domain-containing protein [Klebsiella pneumoniae]|uniref:DGQHR domain-containing protein n=1 Tax=Klebsiella pneumoniae TaxID=573 RepID=UPI0010845811|nr:DGQHR domain-containing protein [Klebsiella pneumoniae]VGL58249.1 DNA phosphorothioation-associated DGQHR protein 1 [Klebsiella pneumoniae]
MNYFSGPSLRVKQPFGDFYVFSIPAKLLVKVCYSFAAKYGDEALTGVQRGINKERVKAISNFFSTKNAMFPTSVILSADLDSEGKRPKKPWFIDNSSNLVIPTDDENASIVDGQHRIEGLKKAIQDGTLDDDFDILCAVYFELPAPKQAEVFATINFNQQKVDKSLAYQLFGYDLDAEDSKYWSPDTLAIYLTRLLEQEDKSVFKGHIDFGMKKIIPRDESEELQSDSLKEPKEDWTVSTSTIVQGITSLISTNVTGDRYYLHQKRLFKKDRAILNDKKSNAPFRKQYIEYKDGQLYDILIGYFSLCKAKFWDNNKIGFMTKTIAIQALFDLLKLIMKDLNSLQKELSEENITPYLLRINEDKLIGMKISFSGIGRTEIKNLLKNECGL